MNTFKNIIFYLFLLVGNFSFCQISQGGFPPSSMFNINKSAIQTIEIQKPDLSQTILEDELSDKKGEAYRMGILLLVNKNISNSGTWTILSNGDKIWQLRIKAKGALATSLYFSRFYLPKGAQLFLYNDDKSQIIGAFTASNNSKSGLFSTELIEGDAINIEYFQPNFTKDSVKIEISEINYAYRGVSFINKWKYGFGSSGNCEVNVNCSEGDNWQQVKAGVVRINVKVGGSSKWCTGSVVNNTLQDFKPYLLSADHCESGASVSDINQWVFYFNYEAPSCINPSNEGNLASKSMTGAVKISDGGNGGNSGSDFLLLLLNQEIPQDYNPYFLGWDRTEDSSLSGVTIHHPAGDIKKISTYTTPLATSYWVDFSLLSHWRVQWQATSNGYGVTEGGSSGAPVFNSDKRVVGTLTGGDSDCNNLIASDYYGKFSWHWDKNGGSSIEHLKEWLDPIGSNPLYLEPTTYKKVDFNANNTKAKVGETIDFYDKSVGNFNEFNWTFENGSPSSSTNKNPKGITYSKPGYFDVELKVISPDTSYNLIKNNYIHIWDDVNIFVNEQTHKLCIDLNNNSFEKFSVSIFNLMGKEVATYNFSTIQEKLLTINIDNFTNGVYLIRIITEAGIYDGKVLINF